MAYQSKPQMHPRYAGHLDSDGRVRVDNYQMSSLPLGDYHREKPKYSTDTKKEDEDMPIEEEKAEIKWEQEQPRVHKQEASSFEIMQEMVEKNKKSIE